MAIVHKYDNGLTGWGSGPSPTIAYTYGTPFKVSAACGLTQLTWYRAATGTPAPTSLRLYNRDTGGLLTSAPAVPDNAAVGWQIYTLPSAIGLVAGTEYMVTAGFNLGGGEPFKVGTSFPTLPSAFASTTNYRYYHLGANTYPDTGDTSYFYGLDVEIDTSITPAEPPPITSGDVSLELADWLSSDSEVQTHETDGLPYLTKVAVDSIETTVENIPTATDPPWVTVLKLWQIAGALTDVEIAAWNLFAQRAPAQLTGGGFGGGSAFYSSDGRQVAQTAANAYDQTTAILAAVADLQAQVTALEALVSSPREPLAGFPSEFDLVDSFSFTDCLAWNVAADVYVLHCTTLPARLAISPVCGINMIPRLGWWAPLADTLTGSRRFIDFEFNLIYDASGRLPGILVELGAGGEATIEAYVASV